MWPVKPVPDMTYNVFGGTLNLTQQQQKRPLANLCFSIKSGISSIIHSCFFVRGTRGSISPTSLTVWLSILNSLYAPLSVQLSSAILQRTSFLNSIHFSYLELVSFHAWSWFLTVLFFFQPYMHRCHYWDMITVAVCSRVAFHLCNHLAEPLVYSDEINLVPCVAIWAFCVHKRLGWCAKYVLVITCSFSSHRYTHMSPRSFLSPRPYGPTMSDCFHTILLHSCLPWRTQFLEIYIVQGVCPHRHRKLWSLHLCCWLSVKRSAL